MNGADGELAARSGERASAATFDQVLQTEVVVIGSGVAGQRMALALAPHDVVLLTKGTVEQSGSSPMAQGGIAAAVGEEDSAEQHARDTLGVAGGLGVEESVRRLTAGGAEAIAYLSGIGAHFTRDEDGSFELGREAAHSTNRILHAHGDQTGKEVVRALSERLRAAEHVTVMEHATALDLARKRGSVRGVQVRDASGASVLLLARHVVLATGGVGQVFACTTNPTEVTGDGLAMAARAGARLVDLEFVQFHPTAIAVDSDPLPLATEALRGAGATLIDRDGVRVMRGVHPDLELAPRDVVARRIFECREELDRPVYLDATRVVGEAFPEKFPTVFAHCQRHGVDPRREPIPVTPAVHYHMGGVWVDAQGRTSLPGLWAVGEVASTGVHGANRLASNSLLEGLVFGRLAAETLGQELEAADPPRTLAPLPEVLRVEGSARLSAAEVARLSQTIRSLMWQKVGVVRTGSGLLAALDELRRLSWIDREGPAELRTLWTVARLVASAASARSESRGSHFRSDQLEPLATWRRRIAWTLESGAGGRWSRLTSEWLGDDSERVADGSGALGETERERTRSRRLEGGNPARKPAAEAGR